ncbi:MAG: hypothetical protein PUP46_04330 [Endozoicomonas sp. (ex Botrylloides leachii)]|nr:hypothetical protein [Endozoicomonas sp. (ex Botrylloides leachii)]
MSILQPRNKNLELKKSHSKKPIKIADDKRLYDAQDYPDVFQCKRAERFGVFQRGELSCP